jgi:hypothetical protein
MEASMPSNEWDLLKRQFDALVHDESVAAEHRRDFGYAISSPLFRIDNSDCPT